jgi:hypothetical protein
MICIARAWVVLMKRLGYTQFVAQGGDWGALIVDMMGVQATPGIDRHSHQHAWCCSTRRFKGDPSENEDKKKKRRSSRKGASYHQ